MHTNTMIDQITRGTLAQGGAKSWADSAPAYIAIQLTPTAEERKKVSTVVVSRESLLRDSSLKTLA